MRTALVPGIHEVVLAGDPRGPALLAALSDPARHPPPRDRHLALGARCPHCGRDVMIVLADGWTAEDLAARLRAAGRCLHSGPPPGA